MKTTEKGSKPSNEITNKEYRKSVRRAARARKKEAKKKAAAKNNSTAKRYDVLVQYHSVLKERVRKIVETNKIKYAILTDAYFVCSNISEEEYLALVDKFKDCKVERTANKNRVISVKFAKWKSKTIISNTKEDKKKPSNNTNEARQKARAARKAKNKAAHQKFVKYANNDAKRPTANNPVPLHGRNTKKLMCRHGMNKFKSLAKVTPALKENSLERKLRQRAAKASKYLLKKERGIKPSVSKKKKSQQMKLKLAA